ncbi:MAG: ORF6N domain-containing protein [Bacteroidetes bacterium]|nr:ORF6N domain-containing protein [Bacteroidota bacterium]
MEELAPKEEFIADKILKIRNQKVLIDADLATLYGVTTKALKQQVRRNIERFPEDFMFELTKEEFEILRCQIGTSSWGGTRYSPMAFTEQGVAMLSSVLGSPTAVQVNIQIMRVFVKMRNLITRYEELLEKVEALEASALEQNEHIIQIYEVIKELVEPAYKNRQPIGYRVKEGYERYIRKHQAN